MPHKGFNAEGLHCRAQEAELTKDLWRQLTVPVTALHEMQGYIMTTSARTSSSSTLKKVRVPDQNIGKSNLFIRTFPHEIVFFTLK